MRSPDKATSLCTYCPKLCRFSCPVADADRDEATTPWGKMSTMKRVEGKRLPMDRETMGLAYKCLNCRHSQSVCELNNPVSSVLDTCRVRAFKAGLAPGGVSTYCRDFQQVNNPFGKDLLALLQRNFPKKVTKRKKIVYFPGCTEIAKDLPAIGRTLDLLEKLKVRDIGLYPEPIQCCGYPLFVAGDWDNFTALAEINSHAFNDYSLIITGSPACLYTMETLYRKAGYSTSAKFMHIVEYLAAKLIPDGGHRGRAVSPPIEARIRLCRSERIVAYHDPCYLGRYRKRYNEPRELIRRVSGRPPREFSRNREESYCCGAGGLLPVSYPKTAEKITENRIEEFRMTGAELLVTSCPTCVQRFKKYGKGIQVKNLVEYLTDGTKK